MAHKKVTHKVPVGGQVVCGSRRIKVDAVGSDFLDITITKKRGETLEVRDPKQRDQPWVLGDPGEGEMEDVSQSVTVGQKIRVGNHRQFRVLSATDKSIEITIVGPDSEL